MFGSFFTDNPLLAAIAVTAAIAVAVLLLGTGIVRLFGLRRSPAAAGGAGSPETVAGWDYAHPQPVATPAVWTPDAGEPHRRSRRSGFGFGAVGLAFLLGVVAGGVGLALSSRQVATAVAPLLAMVEPALLEANPDTADGEAIDSAAEGVAGGGTAGTTDVGARLAAFADKLKASLPRAAGPELALTRVDLNGTRLSLGYAVGRVMAPEETQAFDAYIMRTAKSLFCGQESREIRSLSEAGVVFDMEYVDPAGATVTRLTVEPGFCA
jgi:hypothetical protein